MTNDAIQWTELRVLVPLGWQELVAETVCRGACTTAAFGRSSLAAEPIPEGSELVRTYLPSHADGREARAEIERAVTALVEATGAPELANLTIEWRAVPPEDWEHSWKKGWKPFRVGRLCLLPPWKEAGLREGEARLTIEPAGAFGSGRHATTRTCLRALSQRIRGGERVLDAGSGSGVLAVAAALLGARECIGFDVDPNATPIAVKLAADNGVVGRCAFRSGGFETLGAEDVGFDVALANIYSDVIQAHARDLRDRLAPDGWFAASGCPDQHLAKTRAALERAGLRVDEDRRRGRWHTLLGGPA